MILVTAACLISSLLGGASAFPSVPSSSYDYYPLTNSTSNTTAVVCNATFNTITANEWVSGSDPGWNLGNTLDATPSEGDWNNPVVSFSTFDDVKKAGFKSIRLPGKFGVYGF